MKAKENFLEQLDQNISVFSNLNTIEDFVLDASDLINNSVKKGGKLMLCGNGGSAADSQHIAAELVGRFIKDRRPLPAIALSTDTSAITCISNDYGYDYIFSRQVESLGMTDDVLLAISTSGNSSNVMESIKTAKQKNIKVIGLLGKDGGNIKEMCDIAIVVPSNVTARIQEVHIFLGHFFCLMLEKSLGLDN